MTTTHAPQPARAGMDLHAHWTPPPLADALRRRSAIPRISGPADRETYHSIYGERPFAALEHDLAERLALMDRHGLQLQLLSLPGLFGIDCLEPAEALPLLALFNEQAAAACRRWPDRFLALAALPHRDITLACAELRRAHGLGLRGAILPADGFVSLAQAERFRPLLALAHRLGSHLFIHPGPLLPPGPREVAANDAPWLRHIVLGTQARLSEVMATLNLTDYLDPYPDLTVQVANLGGAMPFYLERIDQVGRVQLHDARPSAPRLRRCHVDTSSFGPLAIAMAVRCFGAERVVLGSDCPIFDLPAMLQALRDCAIDEAERALVMAGNARRIFGLSMKETRT